MSSQGYKCFLEQNLKSPCPPPSPAHQPTESQSACPWIFSVSMRRSHLVVISITMAFSNRGIYQRRGGTSFRQSCILSHTVSHVKKISLPPAQQDQSK